MQESEYRKIVEECIEFGWLNQYQREDFLKFEREILLPGLAEFRSPQQILAAMFLEREFLESGVAIAPSGIPARKHLARASLPASLDVVFSKVREGGSSLSLHLHDHPKVRHRVASAAAQWAKRQGFRTFRAVGRLLGDGRKEPLLEELFTEMLHSLEPRARRDFCTHRGQYLQLMAPLDFFAVRPGGVFNIDPGMNRLKLLKASLDLLYVLLAEGPVCVLAEEVHRFPRLALEWIAYLAWIARSGSMGLSGLGREERSLDEWPFLLVMTGDGAACATLEGWVERLQRRSVWISEIDSA